MQNAEYDFNISVEFTYGENSYWIPTPEEELEELECYGIIDIGDDQDDFEKLISLIPRDIEYITITIIVKLHKFD